MGDEALQGPDEAHGQQVVRALAPQLLQQLRARLGHAQHRPGNEGHELLAHPPVAQQRGLAHRGEDVHALRHGQQLAAGVQGVGELEGGLELGLDEVHARVAAGLAREAEDLVVGLLQPPHVQPDPPRRVPGAEHKRDRLRGPEHGLDQRAEGGRVPGVDGAGEREGRVLPAVPRAALHRLRAQQQRAVAARVDVGDGPAEPPALGELHRRQHRLPALARPQLALLLRPAPVHRPFRGQEEGVARPARHPDHPDPLQLAQPRRGAHRGRVPLPQLARVVAAPRPRAPGRARHHVIRARVHRLHARQPGHPLRQHHRLHCLRRGPRALLRGVPHLHVPARGAGLAVEPLEGELHPLVLRGLQGLLRPGPVHAHLDDLIQQPPVRLDLELLPLAREPRGLLPRRPAGGLRRQAQLARLRPAPGEDVAVHGQRRGMSLPRRHLPQRQAPQRVDLVGHVAVLAVPDAELARGIVPPREHRAVHREAQRVVGAAGHGPDPHALENADDLGVAVEVLERHLVRGWLPHPALAVLVAAPGHHPARGQRRHRVLEAAGHRRDLLVVQGQHHRRPGAHLRRPVALGALPAVRQSPRDRRAAGAHRDHVAVPDRRRPAPQPAAARQPEWRRPRHRLPRRARPGLAVVVAAHRPRPRPRCGRRPRRGGPRAAAEGRPEVERRRGGGGRGRGAWPGRWWW